ncbi:MAG: hypothetical protein M1817_000175 [Caeruleum heppii]|nr:MAG: hypothetical protein M1817_000175 [Caeruleum heppii]
MANHTISLKDVEHHRQLLEENVASLRKALRHWQVWEAEYEGLKEEISAHEGPSSDEDVIRISGNYGGELVTDKEIKELVYQQSGNRRSLEQIVNVLSRRIEYVQKNIKSISGQLDAALENLERRTSLDLSKDQAVNDLQPIEIVEELDENGNVVSSTTSTPGQAGPDILQALRRAGVDDAGSQPQSSHDRSTVDQARKTSKTAPNGLDKPVHSSTNGGLRERAKQKKSVSFTPDTKPAEELCGAPTNFARSPRNGGVFNNVTSSATSGRQRPAYAEDQDLRDKSPSDSPEEAALRRDMLQYGLSEVDAIVAEIQLDEDGSQLFSEDDESIGEDEFFTTNDDDEEVDEDGDEAQPRQGKKSMISDRYRREMEALAKKLDAQMMTNVGPKPAVALDEDIAPSMEATEYLEAVLEAERAGSGKGAESTDTHRRPAVEPTVRENIVEGNYSKSNLSMKPSSAARKQSLFKSERSSAPTIEDDMSSRKLHHTTHPPNGVPLSDTLIERPVAASYDVRFANFGADDAVDEAEIDSGLLRQEVSSEYHRRRNRMVHQQGGFTPDTERERVPLTEEEGGPKKRSLFMATRLGQKF